ncbi:MAG: methylmalonyl-CoA mutase subunit beta [Xanthobacteraceae bacterium]|nr:methylmalonyl-CoA mutase subunit beta [Xanthobacteraceae bacterium]
MKVAFGAAVPPWHFATMTDELPLAAEFPPATREDWLKLVRAALKDRPFERLIAKTYDGIPIEPLYPRAADARPVAARRGPWAVQARVDHPDPAAANAEALHELENGATGLTLVFSGSIGAYGYGLPGDPQSIARALEGVHLDAIAIELQTAEPTREAADHVAALVKSRGHAPGAVNIRFGHDALGAHTLTGTLPIPYRDLMPRFGEHVASLANAGFKSPLAAADGRIVHNAGGSEVQELAYALSVAVAYLRALEGAGIALDAARTMIEFRLAADTDQFLTVAKFRALRLLWARIEQACGFTPGPALISAETAWRMMTRRDPWVNMLRTTIAALSAGIGGADAVSVLPFTAALGLPDRFARRIARNTELLLLEESNLAKVSDPAAGAGGIEDLTDKLCRAAWTLFQEIEAAGGAPAALEKGLIQDKIAKVRAERENAAAHRKDALTGTSDYPLLAEMPVKVLDARPVAIPPPAAAIRYPALAPHRLAEPYEALRDASDRMLAATGARPKIFLANLGTLAEFTPRAAFAKNFFEAGGIETITNDGFKSRDEMIAAFKASGTKLACLCSSDAVYETEAVGAASALAQAGATHIYLAGRPKDAAHYKTAGVKEFIYAGSDALATLRAARDILTGRR